MVTFNMAHECFLSCFIVGLSARPPARLRQREELAEMLVPIVANADNADITEVSLAALALGLIFVGTCNDDIGGSLVQRLMECEWGGRGRMVAWLLGCLVIREFVCVQVCVCICTVLSLSLFIHFNWFHWPHCDFRL